MNRAVLTPKITSLNFNDLRSWFESLPKAAELSLEPKPSRRDDAFCFSVKSQDRYGDFAVGFQGEGIETKLTGIDVYTLHDPSYKFETEKPLSFDIASTRKRSKASKIEKLDEILGSILMKWLNSIGI